MEGDDSIFGTSELNDVVESMSGFEREENPVDLLEDEAEGEGGESEFEGEGEGEFEEIECEEEDISTDVLLFTFFMLFIGLFTRHFLGKIPIPYTGMLLVRELHFGR